MTDNCIKYCTWKQSAHLTQKKEHLEPDVIRQLNDLITIGNEQYSDML